MRAQERGAGAATAFGSMSGDLQNYDATAAATIDHSGGCCGATGRCAPPPGSRTRVCGWGPRDGRAPRRSSHRGLGTAQVPATHHSWSDPHHFCRARSRPCRRSAADERNAGAPMRRPQAGAVTRTTSLGQHRRAQSVSKSAIACGGANTITVGLGAVSVARLPVVRSLRSVLA